MTFDKRTRIAIGLGCVAMLLPVWGAGRFDKLLERVGLDANGLHQRLRRDALRRGRGVAPRRETTSGRWPATRTRSSSTTSACAATSRRTAARCLRSRTGWRPTDVALREPEVLLGELVPYGAGLTASPYPPCRRISSRSVPTPARGAAVFTQRSARVRSAPTRFHAVRGRAVRSRSLPHPPLARHLVFHFSLLDAVHWRRHRGGECPHVGETDPLRARLASWCWRSSCGNRIASPTSSKP